MSDKPTAPATSNSIELKPTLEVRRGTAYINGPRLDQQKIDRELRAAALPDSVVNSNPEVAALREKIAIRERRHKHVIGVHARALLEKREAELRETIATLTAALAESALDSAFDDNEDYLDIRNMIHRAELLLEAVLLAQAQIPKRESFESDTSKRLLESKDELHFLIKDLKLKHLAMTEHLRD